MQDNSHCAPLEELSDKFQTDFQRGLSSEQAQINLEKFGANICDKDDQKKPSILKKLIAQQITLKYRILWTGILVSFGNYFVLEDITNFYNGLIILMTILSTSIISIRVDNNNDQIYEDYKRRTQPIYEVVRSGVRSQISSKQIVTGDIIFIQQGQIIPADCRVLEADNLYVDNSTITGEAIPMQRSAEPTSSNRLESQNALFASTSCSSGEGKCLVTATGKSTLVSQLMTLNSPEDNSSTYVRVERMTEQFYLISLFSALTIFLLLIVFGNVSVSQSLQISIALAVIMIPFTLSAKYKISLHQTLTNLFAKNLLVKDLRIFEKADQITCICADKTGTLTKSQLIVSHLWYGGNSYKVKDNSEEKVQLYDLNNLDSKILLKASLITCDAQFDLGNVKDKKNIDYQTCQIKGDASNKGILKFLQSIEDVEKARNRFTLAKMRNGDSAKLPFNSVNQFSFDIIEEDTKDSHFTVYFKGSPEKLLSYSSFYLVNNNKIKIDDLFKEKLNQVMEDYSHQSERILGYAKLHLSSNDFPQGYSFDFTSRYDLPFQIEDLEFCGLITICDEIKPEVKETVDNARKMGIKTIMITGDLNLNAVHVAREVGIIPKDLDVNLLATDQDSSIDWKQSISQKQAVILGGYALNQISKQQQNYIAEIAQYVKKPYAVFYRMAPANKLQVVDALQYNSEVVASIGDGVNDFAFLKKSDISISMNLQSSNVAKKISQVISLDDKIDSTLSLISEARQLQINLRNSLSQYLQIILIELAILLAFFALRIPLPLSSFQLLIIPFFFDVLPTFASAYSKPNQTKNSQKLNQKVNPLSIKTLFSSTLSFKVILSLLIGFSSYFFTFQYFGFKINSLFGVTKITGYLPPLSDFNQIQDPFFNEDLFKIAPDCTQNTEISDKLKFELDWFDNKQKSYDLRKSLLKCDLASKKWIPVVDWSSCTLDSITDRFSNKIACYSTNALYWAQISFFTGIFIVFLTSKLFNF